jgi:PAS domain S-box-containing protein/putative nucleotidyltransferase with HDIG domain
LKVVDSSFISTDENEIYKIHQEALEFAKIGACRFTADGTIIFIDRSALQILEITDKFPDPNALLGKNIDLLFHYIRPKNMLRKEILRNKHISNSDYPFQTLDGKEKWVSHDSYVIENAQTGEKIIQSIFQDITSRKKSERIQNSIYSISEATLNADNLVELFTAIHATVRQLMPALNFYIALYDPATDLVSFPYFIDKYDPPPQPRKPGKGVTEYVLRTSKPLLATPKIIQEMLQEGHIEDIGAESIDWLGVPLILKGETIGVLAVQSYSEDYRYRDEDKEILEFVSTQIAMAIQRKRAEEALHESEELFKSFMDFLPAAASVKDELGRAVYINRFLADFFSIRDWANKTFAELIPKQDTDIPASIELKALSKGSVARLEKLRNQKGEERYFQTYKFPVRREAKPDLIGGISIDFTDRIRAEEQVQKQLERLGSLRTIDLAISGSVELKVTLNIVIDQVISRQHVDASDVLILNETNQVLEFAAGRGFFTSNRLRARLRLGEEYAGRAALNRDIVAIPDLSVESDATRFSPYFPKEDFKAYYAVPLISKGQIKGVLEIFHRSPLNPDQDWLDYFQSLGMQAAIAIDDAQLFDNLQRSNTELIVAYDATIEGWARALELRDLETSGHTIRVTDLTERMAARLGINRDAMVHLRRGAILHDIGKMAIPETILLKTTALSLEEAEIIHQHPGFAYKLLNPIPFLRPALEIPLCHHEKWDGSGYPRGLKGEEIPLAARIFSVVDVWEALTSDRPYRVAWPEETALRYITSESGKQFDPVIVDEFMKLHQQKD